MISPTTKQAFDNAPAPSTEFGRPLKGWRLKAYTIIFEADTKAGRLFDLGLMVAVLLSLVLVMLESVASFRLAHAAWLSWAEYAFTALFTLEYVLRLVCVRRPLSYASSFFGIVDLLAVLPIYLAFFFPELYALVDVRVLRLLRVFRILKLNAYVAAYLSLGRALRASSKKILVFLSAVLMIVLIMGTVMYVVEGPENGFSSIPVSVYWAISTVTTVGFGDITPKTDLGRFIASLMMLLGWGVLAVPTGIMTAEMAAQRMGEAPAPTTRTCHACLREGLQADSHFCRHCGAPLPEYQRD
ncbi:ion transporter [Paucibacter sp. B2R-40]|uniref:ion transporter n=1 Tax=Paucibacter sp. B2R-40 TaxID=2893554 RepID=UPI0021E4C37D|nr:ion transporter [Paucibacter sp. B2R-40]MCV2355791.1 ion transporter [Paucibacter sp. B2R-40]